MWDVHQLAAMVHDSLSQEINVWRGKSGVTVWGFFLHFILFREDLTRFAGAIHWFTFIYRGRCIHDWPVQIPVGSLGPIVVG